MSFQPAIVIMISAIGRCSNDPPADDRRRVQRADQEPPKTGCRRLAWCLTHVSVTLGARRASGAVLRCGDVTAQKAARVRKNRFLMRAIKRAYNDPERIDQLLSL